MVTLDSQRQGAGYPGLRCLAAWWGLGQAISGRLVGYDSIGRDRSSVCRRPRWQKLHLPGHLPVTCWPPACARLYPWPLPSGWPAGTLRTCGPHAGRADGPPLFQLPSLKAQDVGDPISDLRLPK
jgi:hypothetical protein